MSQCTQLEGKEGAQKPAGKAGLETIYLDAGSFLTILDDVEGHAWSWDVDTIRFGFSIQINCFPQTISCLFQFTYHTKAVAVNIYFKSKYFLPIYCICKYYIYYTYSICIHYIYFIVYSTVYSIYLYIPIYSICIYI